MQTDPTSLESEMESLEGLLSYLEKLGPEPKQASHPNGKERKMMQENVLQKVKRMLGSISPRELKANVPLRTKARELIKDIFIIETYMEDKGRYDRAIHSYHDDLMVKASIGYHNPY